MIVGDDGSQHSYEVKVDDGKQTILEDGKPLPKDRILSHGNTRVVLGDDGRVVYQYIVDDDGNVIYSSNVPSSTAHAFAFTSSSARSRRRGAGGRRTQRPLFGA